jgi:beta-lactamase regulating signal transducer with metallopeptidase domain
MNLELFLETRTVHALGWALFDSLWQISAISLLLFVALKALRNAAANTRYLLCVFALALSVILPAGTFIQLSSSYHASPDSPGSSRSTILPANHRDGKPQGPFFESDPPFVSGEYFPAANSFVERVSSSLAKYLPEIFPFAVAFWFVGIAFFSIRVGGGLFQLRRFTSDQGVPVECAWRVNFLSLCERLGVRRNAKLVSSEIVETPIATGVLRPVILVPVALFLQMNPRELEMIIAHELVHIRRYDTLVNILQSFIESVLFYHPAVWWISAQTRREREFAADNAVMKFYDGSHVTYAKALANLEEIRVSADRQTPRFAAAANGGNLMQRIQKILKLKTEENRANSAWSAGLAFVFASAVLLTLFSVNSSSYVNADAKPGGRKLAVGFVSIPPLDRTDKPMKDGEATMRKLIHSLKKYDVPATGFLQGGMVSDGEKLLPGRAEIARMWIDAGFEVGLGGFKHIWLYNTPVDEFIANIEKSERVTKQLLGDMGFPPRYFSYPYLNTGKSAEDRAKVEAWLASRGYTPVKYTFDNQEWMYSYAYDMARNARDPNAAREIREAYLAYMSKMFDHYEAYSSEMFGRDIAQTMVLTPSGLTADTADELFEMARKRGYSFISINEAQQDPAYKTAENFYREAGISWFERWTMAKGEKLRDEPAVDQNILSIWNERKAKGK